MREFTETLQTIIAVVFKPAWSREGNRMDDEEKARSRKNPHRGFCKGIAQEDVCPKDSLRRGYLEVGRTISDIEQEPWGGQVSEWH